MKNKKAQAKILFVIIGALIIGGVIFGTITGLIVSGGENSFNKKIPIEISNLNEFSEDNLNSHEAYEKFASSFNDLIKIMNNQRIYDIPKMNLNEESWKKTLKFITEYGPLVNNYNEVVSSAKQYNLTRLNEDLEEFYGRASSFALELVLINGAVFYGPSYNTVGKVYRASGLQVLAPKCGGCMSVALSTAHWTMRNGLVELSSQFSQTITEKPKRKWDSITIDSLMQKGNNLLDESKTFANDTITDIKNYNYTKTGGNIKNFVKDSTQKTKDFIEGIFNN